MEIMNQPTLFPTGQAVIPRDRTCPKCGGPAVRVFKVYLCRACGAVLAEQTGKLFNEKEDEK